MKIFTIESGKVYEGAKVITFSLKNADVSIPAIVIGEEGRGRELGVLPVKLTEENYKKWQDGEMVKIHFAKVSETKSGKPKLIELESNSDSDEAVVVFRTKIGFRGSNEHTGDLTKSHYEVTDIWGNFDKFYYKEKEEAIQKAKEILRNQFEGITEETLNHEIKNLILKKVEYNKFPGEILTKGLIAQGAAGRMGSGRQMIAIIPQNTVFRTAYSGRLYGTPSEHFYIFDGDKIISVTKEERELTDIF